MSAPVTALDFTDRDGLPARGEVWSPGPGPRSVWVLLPDGRAAAVRLDTGREVAPPIDPRMVPCPGHRVWPGGQWQPGVAVAGDCPRCGFQARNEYLRRFRYAEPGVRVGEWRELTSR